MLRSLLVSRLSVLIPLAASASLACASPAGSAVTAPGYEIVGEDLELFRSAFNAASDDVRAVLLVGPT